VSARGTLPEDLERGPLLAPEEPVVAVAPEAAPLTRGEWVRRNLFRTPVSGAITLLIATAIMIVAYRLVRFLFVTADWTVFQANLRGYMVGRFPVEELWRVWTAVYVLAVLGGLSAGVLTAGRPEEAPRWTPVRRVLAAVGVAAVVGAVVYLVESPLVWVLLAAAVAVVLVARALGRRTGRGVRKPLLVAWFVSFPAILVLLSLGDVRAEQWGGLLLNLIVAIVGIFVSFPIGLLLALGRRSDLPVVSGFCVGVIELIRGVPLVTLLIFGRFVLPLLLPPGLELPQIVRAMLMITIFSSVYVAEIVRGGLQGVAAGQYEAARALGLSPPRLMGLVVLPQALRSTIPSMIGHFISVFKDTSLLAALDIFSDLLDTAERATNEFRFTDNQAEALLPAAFLFWVIAFSMSRWSQRVERRLAVGER
jgi:general L-amino acid transport system permease protein